MQIELAIVAIIIFYILTKSGKISISKLIADNEMYFRRLKESDYEFYVKAKYGDSVNADILFNKRLQKRSRGGQTPPSWPVPALKEGQALEK